MCDYRCVGTPNPRPAEWLPSPDFRCQESQCYKRRVRLPDYSSSSKFFAIYYCCEPTNLVQESPRFTMAESTPDWLQEEGENGHKGGASSSFVLRPPNPPPFQNDIEEGDNRSAAGSCCCCWSQLGAGTLYLISTILLGVFIFSTVVQDNDDDDKILWFLFYSGHAALTASFLAAHLGSMIFGGCSRNCLMMWWDRAWLLAATCMMGFTGFMLWRAVRDYQDAKNDETILEVSGASLGGASVLYHVLLWKCTSSSGGGSERNNSCSKKNKDENDEDDNLDI